MRDRDNISWTTMISGYVRYDKPLEALELYISKQISEKSISNKFTASSALAAVSAIQCLRLGKEIHGCITRTGLDSDESFTASALVHLYSKCGNVENAKRVFDGIPRPDSFMDCIDYWIRSKQSA
ncbi:hypothetical protein QYF36_011743 [Acer negundo]|nr:hypothetical protein QYF36_011743 [Acer negundo]